MSLLTNSKKQPKNFKTPLIIGIPIIAATTVILILNSSSEFLPSRLTINGQPLQKTTLSQATQLLQKSETSMLSKQITLSFKGKNYEFTYEKLGFDTSLDNDIKKITDINDNNSGLTKLKNLLFSSKEEMNIDLKYIPDNEALEVALSEIDSSSLQKPENAYFTYANGQVNIIPEKKGEDFNTEELVRQLSETTLTSEKNIEIPTTFKLPEITEEKLKGQGITDKVAEYTTSLGGSSANRVTNIRLAAKNIDGRILAPGEVFSYNDTVGKRTIESGFKTAHAFSNGKVVEDVGGGICQVSSTLYNAVLLANLEIMERRNHQMTVSYVPLSRDATVNWGTQDFKFKNNTDSYIYIHSEVKNGTVTFQLFGKKSDLTVKLTSETLSTTPSKVNEVEDPTLEEGKRVTEENGHTGYKSRLIKRIYQGDKLIDTITVSNDTYISAPSTVKVGTKKKPVEVQQLSGGTTNGTEQTQQ